MSVDQKTVKKIARLSRIAIGENEAAHIEGEINAILTFVDKLNEVDVAGVEPMTSVTPMALRLRPDEITDGDKVADIVLNAPQSEDGFFLVPKVVD